MMGDLLDLFEIAPIGRAVLESAASLGFEDVEDAVLHEAGRLAGAGAIVTRNRADFPSSTLRVYDPETLVAALDAAERLLEADFLETERGDEGTDGIFGVRLGLIEDSALFGGGLDLDEGRAAGILGEFVIGAVNKEAPVAVIDPGSLLVEAR